MERMALAVFSRGNDVLRRVQLMEWTSKQFGFGSNGCIVAVRDGRNILSFVHVPLTFLSTDRNSKNFFAMMTKLYMLQCPAVGDLNFVTPLEHVFRADGDVAKLRDLFLRMKGDYYQSVDVITAALDLVPVAGTPPGLPCYHYDNETILLGDREVEVSHLGGRVGMSIGAAGGIAVKLVSTFLPLPSLPDVTGLAPKDAYDVVQANKDADGFHLMDHFAREYDIHVMY